MKVNKNGINKIEKFFEFTFNQDIKIKDFSKTAFKVKNLLKKAVKRQLVSDVPVSCLLSGGIDSSAVTSIVSKNIKNLKTFTIGFNMQSVSGIELFFDERADAEKFLPN